MPDLVLELYSEEIPARMQEKAAEHLRESFSLGLTEERLSFERLEVFSTPRRLVLIIWDLANHSDSFFEEKRGPRVGAPTKALSGFARSVGAKESELYKKKESKGEFFFYRLEHPGYLSEKLISKITLKVAHGFPWQKSMRWGDSSFRWVRPLRSILCALYRANQEPKVISLEINGVFSSNFTFGHPSMCPGKFSPHSAQDYISGLKDRKVILDFKQRKNLIWESANKLVKGKNARLITDNSLLNEVAGLVEWPVVLMGKIDEEFLELPKEILQISMREHQKFFSVIRIDTGLLYKFVVVANLESKDDGKSIIEGNSRVLRSRLRDAKFFFNKDLTEIKRKNFDALNHRLASVTFHNKIGSQADRVKEIRKISVNIAKLLNVDAGLCDHAASLCKTDLTTYMVSEFPELQGVMGSIYCKIEGQNESIFNAISDHYKPVTQNDDVPKEMIAVVVAIADRVFTLTRFWIIDEKPSGSKDPFALRRGAISLIRILLEKKLDIKLSDLIKQSLKYEIAQDLYQFFTERFKVYLIEKGYSHDTLRACLNKKNLENPYGTFMQIDQLEKFRKTDLFPRLMDAYRRPNNILNSEENRTKKRYELEPSVELFDTTEENSLMANLVSIEKSVSVFLLKKDYFNALQTLAKLNDSVEAFFENVTINSQVQEEKDNRLHLCNKVRKIMHSVANFSELRI